MLWLLLGPYLAMRSGGVLRGNVFQSFAAFSEHLPSGGAFFGWFGWALAILGLVLPRASWRRSHGMDPRWSLAAGGLLVALLSAGPFAPVDVYGLLSSTLPGFDTVRIREASTSSCNAT